MKPEETAEAFRNRLRNGDLLLGAMIKTPTVHATEILGDAGFDFLVVDQEHAPFDLQSLDSMALAAAAARIASLVRVSDASPSRLLGILDMGFAGVIVPHISSAEAAARIAGACRYSGGSRGFSTSSRAGKYGARGMREHMEVADRSVTVVAMIEDLAALEAVESIVAVDGIDAVLIGRSDLAVAMGETTTDAPRVTAAVERILAACKSAGRRVMLYVGSPEEVPAYIEKYASAFIASSDQGMLRAAALSARQKFRALAEGRSSPGA